MVQKSMGICVEPLAHQRRLISAESPLQIIIVILIAGSFRRDSVGYTDANFETRRPKGSREDERGLQELELLSLRQSALDFLPPERPRRAGIHFLCRNQSQIRLPTPVSRLLSFSAFFF